METSLTKNDCDILIEAVDAWINKDFGKSVMLSMLGIALTNNNDAEARQRREMAEREMELGMEKQKKLRKEQGIIIKAKLLKMRDQIEANNFVENAP
jgi:hypothetical protein